jgi:hypothetical protein
MSGPRYQSKRRAVPSITFALVAASFVAGVPLIAGAAAPPGPEVFVYPTAGQSPVQLERDRYECHMWAVKQSGFDPSQPHLAPHQRVQVVAAPATPPAAIAGAVTGAIIGASVSRPRNAGGGAIVGAVAGALLGAASDAARQKQVDRVQQQYNQHDTRLEARLEQQSSDYRRAIAACLEGRGYTVK